MISFTHIITKIIDSKRGEVKRKISKKELQNNYLILFLTYELKELERVFPKVKAYMNETGLQAVEEQGFYIIDEDGDYVTPLVDGKECAYVFFDKGIAKCAIEKA